MKIYELHLSNTNFILIEKKLNKMRKLFMLFISISLLSCGNNLPQDLQDRKDEMKKKTAEADVLYDNLMKEEGTADKYDALIDSYNALFADCMFYDDDCEKRGVPKLADAELSSKRILERRDKLREMRPVSIEEIPGTYNNDDFNWQIRLSSDGQVQLFTVESGYSAYPGSWSLNGKEITISIPSFVDKPINLRVKREGFFNDNDKIAWRKV
jgi:hypothetical protein